MLSHSLSKNVIKSVEWLQKLDIPQYEYGYLNLNFCVVSVHNMRETIGISVTLQRLVKDEHHN